MSSEQVKPDRRNELEQVFYDHYYKLYACVYRMTGSHQDTEDVLQNAFLKGYKNIDKFRGEFKLYTWFYRIVVNEGNRYLGDIHKLPVTRIAENLGICEQDFFESINYTPNFDDHLIMDEMREMYTGISEMYSKKAKSMFSLEDLSSVKKP